MVEEVAAKKRAQKSPVKMTAQKLPVKMIAQKSPPRTTEQKSPRMKKMQSLVLSKSKVLQSKVWSLVMLLPKL